MNYEVQQALERKVGNLEGVVSNYYNLFSVLLDTIAENSDYKEEYANQILSLKQYL